MNNDQDTLEKLLQIDSLSDYSMDSALALLCNLVDLSFDFRNIDGLRHAIVLANDLKERPKTPFQESYLYYIVGNSWSDIIGLLKPEINLGWELQSEEAQNGIINLRYAFNTIQNLRNDDPQTILLKCQIITNLANLLSNVGRIIEAIELWNRVLQINPAFGMALGNRGYGFLHYARVLYDKGHAKIFVKLAYNDFKQSLQSTLEQLAQQTFKNSIQYIERIVSDEFLNSDFDLENFSIGRSKGERKYRKWVLSNNLFLNPLNDLGEYSIAGRDILSLPNMLKKMDEWPSEIGIFNQMKQEFVSARYLFFHGLQLAERDKVHYSDKGVFLINTLDYPVYALSVEEIKIAFRISYSLFDKIAFFLDYYLNLNIDERRISFRTLWYEEQNTRKGLRREFSNISNWPLRGLFGVSKDLFEKSENFSDCIEPEAKDLNDLRNYLEHKYLKVYTDGLRFPASDFNPTYDKLAYFISRSELESKTLRLLKLIRASILYLAFAVHIEEIKKTRSSEQAVVVNMFLDNWEDRWKI